MRALIWVAVILMGLWSGYWYTGRTAVLQLAEGVFAAAPSQGVRAAHSGLSLAGYPNRFDLTVESPEIADQTSGLGWRAPFLQIFSLSYKPWHVIAAFAPTQTIVTPAEDITLSAAKMQASVVVSPNARLPLDRTTLIGSELGLTSTLGWSARLGELRFATRAEDTEGKEHEIGLEALRLTPDMGRLALPPDLPAVIDRLRIDARLGFSSPLDRFAGANRPRVERIRLVAANLDWGRLALRAEGDLVMAAGMPEGRIDLTLTGWRLVMPLIAASGAIKPEVLPTVERMLETLAVQSGNPEELNLPPIFTGGRRGLAPLPLGPAPRF